ncbi:tetratricopeptide repeat protein [Candidatus Peribacteria bacterium]|nr:tetratricopeptide repeat protein [Candidatus Peribacteria bacterium]
MKVPPRIIAPVVLAIVCAGVLMAFLWWQLTQSTLLTHGNTFHDTSIMGINPGSLTDEPIANGDVSLLHLRQGDMLSLRGEWAEAQEEYAAAVEANGGLPALRKLAQAQMQRRDMRGVESTLKKMKNAGARPEDILLLETIIDLRSGELIKAETVLKAADDSPQKHYGLALLALIQGNHEQAQQEIELTVNGWDPILRSYARTLQSAYQEFALFPEGSQLHRTTLLSRALAQVQECELALPLLVQVTSVKDDYRDAWIVQGYCELITERTEQSIASLEHAYSLDPQKSEIQYFLARAYADMHEYQNAITFFEYALSNGFIPQDEVRRLIAQNALEIGNAGLALDQYEALTQDTEATLEMFEGFTTAAVALGRPEDALAKALQATEKWPRDARAFELLGTVAAQVGQTDTARSAFEQALKLNPNLLSAQEKLSKL